MYYNIAHQVIFNGAISEYNKKVKTCPTIQVSEKLKFFKELLIKGYIFIISHIVLVSQPADFSECEYHVKNIINRQRCASTESEKQYNFKHDILNLLDSKRSNRSRLKLKFFSPFAQAHPHLLLRFFSDIDSGIRIGKVTLMDIQYYMVLGNSTH